MGFFVGLMKKKKTQRGRAQSHGNRATRRDLDLARLLADAYSNRLGQLKLAETQRGLLNPNRKTGKHLVVFEEGTAKPAPMKDSAREAMKRMQLEARRRAGRQQRFKRAALWACEEILPDEQYTAERAWTRVSSALRLCRNNARDLDRFDESDLQEALAAYDLYQEGERLARARGVEYKVRPSTLKPRKSRRFTAQPRLSPETKKVEKHNLKLNDPYRRNHGFENEKDETAEWLDQELKKPR